MRRLAQTQADAVVGGELPALSRRPTGAEHVVVGISMDSVDRTRSTLVEAEAIVGPILLRVHD